MLRIRKNQKKQSVGQVMIEYTFCMIIVFMMIYSITKIFEWTGKEVADKRITHDTTLRSTATRGYTTVAESEQLGQISPYFSFGSEMNAIWTN